MNEENDSGKSVEVLGPESEDMDDELSDIVMPGAKKKLRSIADAFGTDKKMEKDGIVVNYDDFDCHFMVARCGGSNTRYTRILAKKTMPYRAQLKKLSRGDPDERTMLLLRRLQRESFIEGALVFWFSETFGKNMIPNPENVEEPLEFTPENAAWLFSKYADLYEDLEGQASEGYNFRSENAEETAKN